MSTQYRKALSQERSPARGTLNTGWPLRTLTGETWAERKQRQQGQAS